MSSRAEPSRTFTAVPYAILLMLLGLCAGLMSSSLLGWFVLIFQNFALQTGPASAWSLLTPLNIFLQASKTDLEIAPLPLLGLVLCVCIHAFAKSTMKALMPVKITIWSATVVGSVVNLALMNFAPILVMSLFAGFIWALASMFCVNLIHRFTLRFVRVDHSESGNQIQAGP